MPCDVSASSSGYTVKALEEGRRSAPGSGEVLRGLRSPSGRRLRELQVDGRRPMWFRSLLSELLYSAGFSHKPLPGPFKLIFYPHPLPRFPLFFLTTPGTPLALSLSTHPTPFSLYASSSERAVPVPEAAPPLQGCSCPSLFSLCTQPLPLSVSAPCLHGPFGLFFSLTGSFLSPPSREGRLPVTLRCPRLGLALVRASLVSWCSPCPSCSEVQVG